MFAAISSLLPAGMLQLERGKDSTSKPTEGDDQSNTDASPMSTYVEAQPAVTPLTTPSLLSSAQSRPPTSTGERSALRSRRPRSEKPLNETYIIVRPPPAKNNHPLNLQIQLVPPRLKDNTSRSASLASQQSGEYYNASIDPQAQRTSSPSPTTAVFGPSYPTPTPPSHDLKRVASIRSNNSDRSAGFYASTAHASSVNSFASTSSTIGGNAPRRIVPLYNLSAHNVMPNYICDAGTDAKVAKFQKRGLEVIRVGTWEPVEVWSSYRQRVSRTPSMAPSEEPGALERNATLLSGGNALSTDLFVRNSPSAFELPGPGKRSSINEKSPSVHLKDLPPPMQTSPPPSANPAKKLFGKMFKKNSRNGGDDDKSQPASPEPSSSEFSSRSKRFSARIGALSVPLSPQPSVFSGRSGHVSSSHSQPHEPILQPPVLGLQAALHSSHSAHPTGRPAHYIWCLRKWAKEKQLNPDSLLKALAVGFHGLNLNLLESHEKKHGKDSVDTSSTGDIEVRFEWSRGKSASSRGKERERQVMLNFKSPNPPRRSSFVENENGLLPPATGEDRNKDIETMSSTYSNHSRASLHSNVVQRSPESAGLGLTLTQGGDGGERSPSRRRSPTISRDDDTGMTDADDGGADSDPEDSETPWTCTLHIYPSHLPPLTEQEAKERALLQQQRRLSASDPNPSSGDDNDLPPLPTDGRIRFKLASLVPTPHHPKILGQFKLPFPLPDVAITPNASSSLSYLHSINSTASFSAPYSDSQTSPIPIALRRYESGVGARFLPRTLAPDGSIMRAADVTVSDGKEGGGVDVSTEVFLTAEDIKDVVSSTGLWLCVREGFGGLGRTKRKGDGWHIRA